LPLDRQTTIDKQLSQPGIRRSAELVVPSDVNTLILRFVPDATLWATESVIVVYGIERQVVIAWQHVVSAFFVTDGTQPTDRSGTPQSEIYLRQMLQLEREVLIDGKPTLVKADDFEWAGQTVRAFCLISEPIDYKLDLEGQQLTDRKRIATMETPGGVL